jgi:hypothetical protein
MASIPRKKPRAEDTRDWIGYLLSTPAEQEVKKRSTMVLKGEVVKLGRSDRFMAYIPPLYELDGECFCRGKCKDCGTPGRCVFIDEMTGEMLSCDDNDDAQRQRVRHVCPPPEPLESEDGGDAE